jgi:hypothetical protein
VPVETRSVGLSGALGEATVRKLRSSEFRKHIQSLRKRLVRVQYDAERLPDGSQIWEPDLPMRLDVQLQIDECDRLLAKYPPHSKHRDADEKTLAAEEAFQLLKRLGRGTDDDAQELILSAGGRSIRSG